MTLSDWKPLLLVVAIGCLGILARPMLDSDTVSSWHWITADFQRSVAACQATHAEWGRSLCERIAREEIWIGMTEDMLRASLGEPRSIEPLEGESPSRENWIYLTARHGQEVLQLCDGVLFGWGRPPSNCTSCDVKPPRPQP